MNIKKVVPVSGIMLRNAGQELIVEAEIDGNWVEVIREFVGPMQFSISYIVEPDGILRNVGAFLPTDGRSA